MVITIVLLNVGWEYESIKIEQRMNNDIFKTQNLTWNELVLLKIKSWCIMKHACFAHL